MKQRRLACLLTLVGVFTFAAPPLRAEKAAGATAAAPSPAMPAIERSKLEPASLTLRDGRDEQRVLVFGVTDGDRVVDLTSQATFKPPSAIVEVDAQGYLRPKSKGSVEVLVSAAGRR